MKQFSFILLGSCFLAMPLQAQTTMSELFKVMPDSLLPYLSQNNRLDLIDFREANMEAKVTNLLDGQTRMTALTADSLVLELSPSSTIRLYLLPVSAPVDSANHIICMVSTIHFSESRYEQSAQCYSLHWHPLTDKELPTDLLQQVLPRRRSTILKWDDERLDKKPI